MIAGPAAADAVRRRVFGGGGGGCGCRGGGGGGGGIGGGGLEGWGRGAGIKHAGGCPGGACCLAQEEVLNGGVQLPTRGPAVGDQRDCDV